MKSNAEKRIDKEENRPLYDDGADEVVQMESIMNNSMVESQQNDRNDPLVPVMPPMIDTFLIA